ncbi:sulfatase [Sphingobacterium hungaricum]|uniref:Iduronate-2-sulfatase n=1 Tax=Sphingobacterium hungaricum TaxID=2082723 RepID=A0A928V071_9SPHI|nr:sulfatase [Sphingobacterium hungaricum]MBE8714062.1 iduronate-2-sulfatase [Sphingobacterium hungaricum]
MIYKIGLLCLLSIFFTDVNGQDKKRLNVLFVLVDDLRPSIGAFGDSLSVTPNLDQLAKSSHVFERAYTNQAVCVASRYNLLLGARSTSTGLYDFGRAFRDFYPQATTLPEYFKKEGYHTEAIGKVFHVGHNTYNDEQSWSVPHFHEKVIEYADKSTHSSTREEALFANVSWAEANQLPKGAAYESPDVSDDTYADGRVANRAMQRLEELKNTGESFFMAVGFARPHLPFSVPKKYWDLYNEQDFDNVDRTTNPDLAPKFATKRDEEISQYAGIPLSATVDPFPDSLAMKLRHGYYAGVSYVDAQIGKVIQKLQETGLDSNTIVVLWGDHGYLLGEMGMWTKHVNYEIANRIPLIIHHPDHNNGVKTKEFIETVDLFPTLAALCGLKTPEVQQPLDGVSFEPMFSSGKQDIREYVYHCFPRGGMLGEAIRDKNFRMVRWTPMRADREVVYELYEYSNGLVETKNIWSEDHPEFIRLKAILESHPAAASMRPESKPRKASL